MTTRVITKALAVEEDMALGKGGVQQLRSGVTYDLHNLSVSKVVSTIAALGTDATAVEFVDPNLFTTVQIESYDTPNDEGGGVFVWDPAINPLNADGGHIFASGVVTLLGAWRRFTDDKIINVRHFGAKGDGVTDDTAAILLAVAAANTRIKAVLYFPEGTYNLDTPLNLTAMDMVIVRGDGQQNTIINYLGVAGPLFEFDTGGEVDELAQFVVAIDFTMRTNRTGLTAIHMTSSALLADITRSAYFARLTFIGETAADGWDFAIHTQDVRGITVKDCYARHVSGSVGTIFWNIDNTIAFLADTYTAFNNETHFYAAEYGALTPTGGLGGSLPPNDSITIAMLADATPGDIITYDNTGNAILLPIGAVGFVLTSNGPGLAPSWQAAGGGGGFDIDALPAVTTINAADLFALSVGTVESKITAQNTANQLINLATVSLSIKGVQAFTANGTYTPTAGTSAIMVFCTGGGGNSSGVSFISGGTSSFGAFCSATGGTSGGLAGTVPAVGTGTGGILNIDGGKGQVTAGVAATNNMFLSGGASFWGGSESKGAGGTRDDNGTQVLSAGSAGGTAIDFISSGFAGTAVTIGAGGGNGGDGVVMVIEFG